MKVSFCPLAGVLSLILAIACPAQAETGAERRAQVAAMLPEKPAACGPPISDRAAWERYAKSAGDLIAEADLLKAQPIPELPADLYLDYSKTGVRTGYQKPYALRTYRLATFVLAECATDQGKYLDAITREMEAILGEKTWVIPAHDATLRTFEGDFVDVDLGAASRGGTIAVALSWLGDKLPAELREKAGRELQRRIFDPYLVRVRTGEGPCKWIKNTNNWNAVCNAAIVLAALAAAPDRDMRAEIILGAQASLPDFLRGFENDGYCREGAGYWAYGFGSYVLLAEGLLRNTGGKINLFAEPKVASIAAFPANFELAPGLLPSFGDAPVYPRPAEWVGRIVGDRLGWSQLEGPPQSPAKDTGPSPLGTSLFIMAITDFPLPKEPATADARPAPHPDPLRGWFPDSRILVSRTEGAKFSAAIKADKTAAGWSHHDHRDLGQFVVGVNGRIPLTDPGLEPYTGKTFSSERWDSQMLNSFGHSVPRLAGQLQTGGVEASIVKTEFTPARDTMVIDLTKAYEVPSLKKLQRTFVFSRENGGRLEVTDEVEFIKPETYEGAVMTYGIAEETAPGSLRVTDGPSAVDLKIATDAGPVKIVQDRLDVKLRRRPIRLGVQLPEPVTRARITYEITPAATEPQPMFVEESPGEVAQPASAARIEAEDFSAEKRGTVATAQRPGGSGQVIEKWADRNHSLTWTAQAPAAGKYALRIRYRCSEPLGTAIQISAGGAPAVNTLLPAASEVAGDWKDWRVAWLEKDGQRVTWDLTQGPNTLSFVNASGGEMGLDWIELVPLGGAVSQAP